MLVDKQNELMSNLLFTVHQRGGDDVTWKPPIQKSCQNHHSYVWNEALVNKVSFTCQPKNLIDYSVNIAVRYIKRFKVLRFKDGPHQDIE